MPERQIGHRLLTIDLRLVQAFVRRPISFPILVQSDVCYYTSYNDLRIENEHDK